MFGFREISERFDTRTEAEMKKEMTLEELFEYERELYELDKPILVKDSAIDMDVIETKSLESLKESNRLLERNRITKKKVVTNPRISLEQLNSSLKNINELDAPILLRINRG